MKTKWMLLVMGSAIGIALAATLVHSADLRPMVVKNITGNLHIVQKIPCDTLTRDIPVTEGRIFITPAEGFDVAGGKSFVLTGFTISFANFTISGSCLGFAVSRNYSFLSVQLRKAVAFTASDRGGGAFDVTIPKDDFLIYETAVVDGRSSEKSYTHPSEDVTGTIDLTRGTVAMHAMVARSIHFREGCSIGCIIDEDDPGTLTVDLSGTIAFPDADADGVADRTDNCRFVANPDQSSVATPIITAPPNLTLASCAEHHIGVAKAGDVCDGGPLTITNNARDTFVNGSNSVTWTARDAKLRTATDTQNVTIVDTTPPLFSFVPLDITMNNCGPAALGVPTATDDCAGTPTFTNNAPAKFLVGTTPVMWTAHDVSGNTTNATQRVTVIDTTPLTVMCVPDGPPGGTFRVSAFDACGVPTVRLGSYVLGIGERIKINETGKSGVTLIGTVGPDHILHFHVGKGEAVMTATDGSGNRASAMCR